MSVKFGILGLAHMHFYGYLNGMKKDPRVQIIGASDHDKQRLSKTTSEVGVTAFETPEQLIDSCDAVAVTSENVKHAEYAVMALERGKHVICEKPLMTTIEDGNAMLDAQRKSGAKFMTAFPCRFSPSMVKLKKMADNGELGKIIAVCGTNRGKCPFGWFVEKQWSGGGAMIDHTVHVADLLRWLLKTEAVKVHAFTSNKMYKDSFEDCAMVSIEFADGAFATIDSSWSRPKSWPTWGDVTMNVIAEKATVKLDMFNQKMMKFSDDTGRMDYLSWTSDIDAGLIKGFLDVIEGINSPSAEIVATGEDGYKAAEIALAAYRSAETGVSIEI